MVASIGIPLHAQVSLSGVIKNYKFAVDADQPGRRTVLTGKGAEPAGRGMYKITGLRAETFQGAALEMVVEAQECFLDQSRNIVESSSSLMVRTGGDQFTLSGKGFLLELGRSHLVVSNDVATTIHKAAIPLPNQPIKSGMAAPALAAAATNATFSTIEINSRRFDYRPEVAVFQQNVRAAEKGQGELLCETLTARFVSGGQLRRLEAEDNVRLVQPNGQAQSDHAVYEMPPADTITLLGRAQWLFEGKEGRAQKMVIQRQTRSFAGEGDVYMKLPTGAMLPADLLSIENTSAPRTNSIPEASTNRFIEIFSDGCRVEGNRALFSGNVRARSGPTQITCARLAVNSSKAEGPPEEITAEEMVKISQGKNEATGDKAVYLAGPGTLVLTGQPRWKIDQAEGSGSLLTLSVKERKIKAAGPVKMLVPGRSGASFGIPLGEANTNSTVSAERVVTISSKEMEYEQGLALFTGDVHATDGQSEMTCGILRVISLENKIVEMVAEKQVRLRDNERRAMADTAVYWLDEGIIRLSGAAELILPDKHIWGDALALDQLRHAFSAKGHYKIEMNAAALRNVPTQNKQP